MENLLDLIYIPPEDRPIPGQTETVTIAGVSPDTPAPEGNASSIVQLGIAVLVSLLFIASIVTVAAFAAKSREHKPAGEV